MKSAEVIVDGVRYVPETEFADRVTIYGMYECHLFHRIDTPKTDAMAFTVHGPDGEIWGDVVPAAFARQLERELRKEHEQCMLAAVQNSALRLQIKDQR
jgi:hypothetical protein